MLHISVCNRTYHKETPQHIKIQKARDKPFPTFILGQAHALVAVDAVSAGGSVLAGRREALVVLLLAVEPVETCKQSALETLLCSATARHPRAAGRCPVTGRAAQTDTREL